MKIIIFGATGDLTHRKLLPALYDNFRKGRLDDVQAVLGYARRDWTDDAFVERARDGVEQFASAPIDEDVWRPVLRPRCSRMSRSYSCRFSLCLDFARGVEAGTGDMGFQPHLTHDDGSRNCRREVRDRAAVRDDQDPEHEEKGDEYLGAEYERDRETIAGPRGADGTEESRHEPSERRSDRQGGKRGGGTP
jgi:hypothetical protein